jgi:hypothetical protein
VQKNKQRSRISDTFRFRLQGHDTGAQIDLLIERQDQCINVCEMKFSRTEFELSKKYAIELQNKLNVFLAKTRCPFYKTGMSKKTFFIKK